LLVLISLAMAQAERPVGRELQSARDAFGGGAPQESEGLRLSKARWKEWEGLIARAMEVHNAALRDGGERLELCIDTYVSNAEKRGSALDHYLAGRILGSADRLEKARVHFQKAIELDPYFYWAHHGLGAWYSAKKMPEAAERSFARALELNPAHAMSVRGRALALVQLGRTEAAENLLRDHLNRDPEDTVALKALAGVLMDRGQHAAAAMVLEELRGKETFSADEELRLALCYRRSDQMERALAIYTAAVQRDPTHWRAWQNLADIAQRQGRNHDAADALTQALRHVPANIDIQRESIQEAIQRLRALPKVSAPDPRAKSLEELMDLMLNSAEVERRRDAARVLSDQPWTRNEIAKAMLNALKDKDELVRALAMKSIAREHDPAQFESLRVLLELLLLRDTSPHVRGLVADLLGRDEQPSAVPVLMKAIEESDPYVFRMVHRALNRCTFAYIEVVEPENMDSPTRQRLKAAWQAWYVVERERYERFEKKQG
jgi:tetratricopeptide (TPR) repeat protein